MKTTARVFVAATLVVFGCSQEVPEQSRISPLLGTVEASLELEDGSAFSGWTSLFDDDTEPGDDCAGGVTLALDGTQFDETCHSSLAFSSRQTGTSSLLLAGFGLTWSPSSDYRFCKEELPTEQWVGGTVAVADWSSDRVVLDLTEGEHCMGEEPTCALTNGRLTLVGSRVLGPSAYVPGTVIAQDGASGMDLCPSVATP